MKKLLVIGIAVLAVAGAAWFFVSVYLVSRLDGTGGVHAPAEEMMRYSSEDGVSFKYPDTYALSSKTEGNAEYSWDALLLVDKKYVPPQNGEGPQAISLSIFPNPGNIPLEQWVKGDARSNYKLSENGTLTAGTVGGEPSLSYQYSGLYENDAVAILYNKKVYLFTVSWSQTIDQIRRDFGTLLSSVTFN